MLQDREWGFVLNGRVGVLPPATAERTQSLCQEDSSWARQAPPGVRSELALVPAHPPRNHGQVGWSMIGVVSVCVRERALPATGSSYPSLRKIMRFSKMKKRVPWREEGNKEEGEAKKRKRPGGSWEYPGRWRSGRSYNLPPTQGKGSILPFLLTESCVTEATASGGNTGQF